MCARCITSLALALQNDMAFTTPESFTRHALTVVISHVQLKLSVQLVFQTWKHLIKEAPKQKQDLEVSLEHNLDFTFIFRLFILGIFRLRIGRMRKNMHPSLHTIM